VPHQFIQNDFAYPAMLSRYLPAGFLGLVVASLIAAYMSTVASQVNWGSSYMVNDFYARFINKEATEKQKVLVGRLSTVVLMFFSVLLALVLKNALQAFQYMLMLGAGTGLIYILRWFWWRINAITELAAMFAAGIFSMAFIVMENFYLIENDGMASLFGFVFSMVYWNIIKFVGVVLLTTIVWLLVTYLTPPASDETLRSFYRRIRPGGPGWKAVVDKALAEGIVLQKEEDLKWDVPTGILCMLLGCVAVYSVLFSTGMFLYGETATAVFFLITAIISSFILFKTWGKLRTS
jgi:Na+/proline symporter